MYDGRMSRFEKLFVGGMFLYALVAITIYGALGYIIWRVLEHQGWV